MGRKVEALKKIDPDLYSTETLRDFIFEELEAYGVAYNGVKICRNARGVYLNIPEKGLFKIDIVEFGLKFEVSIIQLVKDGQYFFRRCLVDSRDGIQAKKKVIDEIIKYTWREIIE